MSIASLFLLTPSTFAFISFSAFSLFLFSASAFFRFFSFSSFSFFSTISVNVHTPTFFFVLTSSTFSTQNSDIPENDVSPVWSKVRSGMLHSAIDWLNYVSSMVISKENWRLSRKQTYLWESKTRIAHFIALHKKLHMENIDDWI